MPEHSLLKKVVKETYERKAVVGAVCHGPVSLLNVKLSNGIYLLAGKNISSFTNDEEENYAKTDVPFELETAPPNKARSSTRLDLGRHTALPTGISSPGKILPLPKGLPKK